MRVPKKLWQQYRNSRWGGEHLPHHLAVAQLKVNIRDEEELRRLYEREYVFEAKEGDIVRMPNGTLGVVTRIEIHPAPAKEVRVYPFTNWAHRLWLTMSCALVFYDRDINLLELAHASHLQ